MESNHFTSQKSLHKAHRICVTLWSVAVLVVNQRAAHIALAVRKSSHHSLNIAPKIVNYFTLTCCIQSQKRHLTRIWWWILSRRLTKSNNREWLYRPECNPIWCLNKVLTTTIVNRLSDSVDLVASQRVVTILSLTLNILGIQKTSAASPQFISQRKGARSPRVMIIIINNRARPYWEPLMSTSFWTSSHHFPGIRPGKKPCHLQRKACHLVARRSFRVNHLKFHLSDPVIKIE